MAMTAAPSAYGSGAAPRLARRCSVSRPIRLPAGDYPTGGPSRVRGRTTAAGRLPGDGVLPFSSRSGMLIDGEVPDGDPEGRAWIGYTQLNEERVAAWSKNPS